MSKGLATEIRMCGHDLRLGDYVQVEYSGGGGVSGKIIEIWSPELNSHEQVRVESGWCFHNYDTIMVHKPAVQDNKEESQAQQPTNAAQNR
jgi:hypothetical protein